MNWRYANKHIALAALALALGVSSTFGQSADALIDKLVEKGILSVKEANDLREETEKNFSQAYAVKSGMPEWVTALKINGDGRVRYEGFFSDADVVTGGTTNRFLNRNRFRYRFRIGATATLLDNLEVGLRLTSSDPAGSFGGDPISGNTTFRDNGSKKFVYFDTAYLKWYAANGPALTGNLVLGKMDSPFVFDDMVWDPDYTPEGAGMQWAYQLSDSHSVKFNAGGFVLDELELTSRDPYLFVAQARWDAAWSKKISTSVGVAGLLFGNSEFLTNATAVPNQNAGNTRHSDGTLAYEYSPLVGDAALTYTAESFPMYRGPFPIRVGGAYMYNTRAPDSADNYGWNAGITFGKAGKKGGWEFSYLYKWLGANATYEEIVDSDFGALYNRATVFPGPAVGAGGYAAGTNVKGHIVKFSYSPADSLTLSAKWFLTELIEPFPRGAKSEMNRLQVDAVLKF